MVFTVTPERTDRSRFDSLAAVRTAWSLLLLRLLIQIVPVTAVRIAVVLYPRVRLLHCVKQLVAEMNGNAEDEQGKQEDGTDQDHLTEDRPKRHTVYSLLIDLTAVDAGKIIEYSELALSFVRYLKER